MKMKKQIYINRKHSEPHQKGQIIRRLFVVYTNTITTMQLLSASSTFKKTII